MDDEHETVEVLELKLQLLQAKKAKEDSVEFLSLKVKLAEAKERETKTNRKKSTKKKKKTSETSKTKNNKNKNISGGGSRTTIIRWSDKANHHMTDSLLGFIEDSASYRQTYGFDRGTFPPSINNSGGKRQSDFDRELATKLFLDIDVAKTDKYKNEFMIDALGTCVRNRITLLKKVYVEHRNTMSQTGHGIVINGQEETIVAGSEIANAWDAVKTVFPWYVRMALLVGGSPVVDRSAVANSATAINLSVLHDVDNIEQSLEEQVLGDHLDNDAPWDIENSEFVLREDEDEDMGLGDSSQVDPPSPSHKTLIDPSLQAKDAQAHRDTQAPSQDLVLTSARRRTATLHPLHPQQQDPLPRSASLRW
ncbi:hypothetical protein K435DRAFT_792411 [Dendrothele bispora CBS 962.96]|uniref:Uncharacterized protein n=1 Tax=Dendrothele bispora (strain CBS 962.96) TaxID=1314807 RepID=A0A4S8MJM8_DENBC|nr:hypothetical protein K435DRAFT_792411 [Dendrothele bispora CBS 962.96]